MLKFYTQIKIRWFNWLIAILLIIVLGFNVFYFSPKVLWKIQQKILFNKQINKNISYSNYFDKVKEISVRELLDPFISPDTRGQSRRIQEVAFWYPTALLSDALVVSHESFDSDTDIKLLVKFYDRYIDSNGSFKENHFLKYLGNVMHGNTLIFLEQVTNGKKYFCAAKQIYYFLTSYPKTRTGIIPYREASKELVLVDSLGMVCPFLAHYGKVYNNVEAVELAELQMLDFINNGTDPATGLPYHGYIAGSEGYVGILGWGRGTGWYLYGLVGTLEYLPDESTSKKQMLFALEKIAETLEIYQQKEGAWPWSITNPYAQKEMSGTAMIAYSIEKAIRLKLLPKKYYQMLDKAYVALVRETTDRGYLMGASGECAGAGRYSLSYGHYPWVQGPTTAFVALFLNRKNINKEVMETKSLF